MDSMKLLQEKIVCYFPPPVSKNQKQLMIQIPTGDVGADLALNDENKICVTAILKPDSLLQVNDILVKLNKQQLPKNIHEVKRLFIESSGKVGRKLTVLRLVQCDPKSAKANQWRNSHAKEILLNKLMDGTIPLTKEELGPNEVYKLHAEFQEFPYINFRTNLNSLRKEVKAQKAKTMVDEAALQHDRGITRRTISQRGYPFWPLSEARELLIQDLQEMKNASIKMTAKVLHSSRAEYQVYPLPAFRDYIGQELRSLNERPYWLHKKKMKQKLSRGENIVDYKGEDQGAGGCLY